MQAKEARVFIGRFKKNSDLLISLIELCRKKNIKLGVFSVIGALTSIKLGYFRQDQQRYAQCLSLDKKLEVVSCTGNISLKESDVFVHAHITLADLEGRCYGGHLMKGSRIFVAEYHVKELTAASLQRVYDPETGLNLWPLTNE
ncbi:MAG: DUF296 domain-containing protein [Candidatus Omnitrophica bacterium]|nr:DUF296 domain-containing protein [Candidatus Omnitrophota bacterium]